MAVTLSLSSGKTLHNVCLTLSSLFTWAAVELAIETPMNHVQPPRFQPKPVEPLTREEVQAMAKACELSLPAATNGRKSFQMTKRKGSRDTAILVTLLDTGQPDRQLETVIRRQTAGRPTAVTSAMHGDICLWVVGLEAAEFGVAQPYQAGDDGPRHTTFEGG